MEREVIFRPRQEVTPDDLMNPQDWAQQSSDHIVADAIAAGRKFVGFDVTQATAQTVAVTAGRLYYNGARYYADADTLDLTALRPALLSRIVAIVGSPETMDTDIQERDVEIDADTATLQPQAVAMERRRNVRLEAVGGAEAVSPSQPGVDATIVVLAFVTVTPAGIQAVTPNVAAQLQSLDDQGKTLAELEAFQTSTSAQVQTLGTDLAKLASESGDSGERALLLDVTADVATLKAQLDIPDTYTGYRALRFLDTSMSDTAAIGFAARIDEGLRFPFAAEDDHELQLFNPYATGIKTSPAGLVLPDFDEYPDRITYGYGGEVSLAQYANEQRTLTRLDMSRTRIRFGGDFEVTTNSAFWLSGTYTARTNAYAEGTFTKDGEVFQTYDTGKTDPDGNKIVRLAKYWADSTVAPYWSRTATDELTVGWAHVETFLNSQDRWITALGPQLSRKPAAGNLIIGICETYRGEPDMTRIRSMVTLTPADVNALVGTADAPTTISGVPKFAIEPTFLEAGQRFGLFIIAAADYWMQISDGSQPATGTYFYGTNGGVWNVAEGVHLLWRVYAAGFKASNVDVQFQSLALPGGVQIIDVLSQSIVPGATDLVFSAQIGGVWRQLDDGDPTILDGLTNLVPFKATFVGTKDVMPGLILPGSVVDFSRLATAALHISLPKALPAPAQNITEKVRLHGFDPAHHTFAPTVDVNGVQTTPSAIVTVIEPDGTVEKTASFHLAATTASYRSRIAFGTDSPLRPFSISDATEIAQ